MINNATIFNIYESLLQNVIKIYQQYTKTNVLRKTNSFRV